MLALPDLSMYSLRFTSTVTLDGRWNDPDELAFDRFDVTLLHHDDAGGEPTVAATAIAFRIKLDTGVDLRLAADAEPDSPLLEAVCLRALEEDGSIKRWVTEGIEDMVTDTLVLDRIRFVDEAHDMPVLRGMLARRVLEHLGMPFTMIFLPPEDAALWSRAVGGVRVLEFVVATAAVELPAFPFRGPAN